MLIGASDFIWGNLFLFLLFDASKLVVNGSVISFIEEVHILLLIVTRGGVLTPLLMLMKRVVIQLPEANNFR